MIIKVKVKAKAGESQVEKKDDFYLVKVKAARENGEANLEMLKLLKRYFKKNARLKSGAISTTKLVEIEN
jgi:uncharacterized protein (TIGR00251 family)